MRVGHDPTLRLDALCEAAAVADEVDDPQLRWRVLNERADLARSSLDPGEPLSIARAIEALPIDTAWTRTGALYERATAAARRGEAAEMSEVCRALTVVAEETGFVHARWNAQAIATAVRVHRGQFDDALALADAAFENGSALGPTSVATHFLVHSWIAELRGDRDEYLAQYRAREEELAPLLRGLASPLTAAWFEGDDERTRALVTAWFDGFTRAKMAWGLQLHYASVFCPFVSPAAAAWAYEQLAPHPGVWMFVGPEMLFGVSDLSLARYAWRAGRIDDAIRHFEAAQAEHVRSGEVPLRATIELELAQALAERVAPGDAERVAPLGTSALAVARSLGLRDVEAAAAELVTR
jgi:tetratricopeptide (TPR) repeat protein